LLTRKSKPPEVEIILPPEEPDEPWSPYPPVGSLERPSNQGWIRADDVVLYPDSIKIKGKFVRQVLPDTNSMEPWMDIGHTVILKRGFDKNKLQVGDVAAYNKGGKWVLHQIVEVDSDENGRFFRFQGINCAEPDYKIVRDDDIQAVLIAVIYTRL